MIKFITKNINYFIGVIIIALTVAIIFINVNQLKDYSRNILYMDTSIYVKVYSKSKSKAIKALDDVEQIYREYHELSDKYNAYKNINNLYTLNHSEELKVDQRLYDLIKYGINWYEKSNHLLNINIGKITEVWKKYRDKGTGLPTNDELNHDVNIDNIILLDDNIIKNNGFNIDLGALSKGYATQKASEHLKNLKISKFLINAGGTVSVGEHYNNGKYSIGIQSPDEIQELIDVIYSNNICVVTSGSYGRYYEYEGKRYHHIIDPNTMYPPNNMTGVTVITKDCAEGDALSTTLFLMTVEEGKEYIKKYDVEALWYTNDNKIIKSEGFSKYEQE